jgi:hypothetical protein
MASGEVPSDLTAELTKMADFYKDLDKSLRLYFSKDSPRYEDRFVGYSQSQIVDELQHRLKEVELMASLAVFAFLEAAFRNDYEQRCLRREKDPVSRALRLIYKTKHKRAKLDEDIFETWRNCQPELGRVIAELRTAFHFRHWLAHGRYGKPKFGRKYDFNAVFKLADTTLRSFPLLAPEQLRSS